MNENNALYLYVTYAKELLEKCVHHHASTPTGVKRVTVFVAENLPMNMEEYSLRIFVNTRGLLP
ncbi:hypothetical protein QG37_00603 [Candidozyma auris]|nr:hypothetical protein QG37_00603 [[Candida] auris]